MPRKNTAKIWANLSSFFSKLELSEIQQLKKDDFNSLCANYPYLLEKGYSTANIITLIKNIQTGIAKFIKLEKSLSEKGHTKEVILNIIAQPNALQKLDEINNGPNQSIKQYKNYQTVIKRITPIAAKSHTEQKNTSSTHFYDYLQSVNFTETDIVKILGFYHASLKPNGFTEQDIIELLPTKKCGLEKIKCLKECFSNLKTWGYTKEQLINLLKNVGEHGVQAIQTIHEYHETFVSLGYSTNDIISSIQQNNEESPLIQYIKKVNSNATKKVNDLPHPAGPGPHKPKKKLKHPTDYFAQLQKLEKEYQQVLNDYHQSLANTSRLPRDELVNNNPINKRDDHLIENIRNEDSISPTQFQMLSPAANNANNKLPNHDMNNIDEIDSAPSIGEIDIFFKNWINDENQSPPNTPLLPLQYANSTLNTDISQPEQVPTQQTMIMTKNEDSGSLPAQPASHSPTKNTPISTNRFFSPRKNTHDKMRINYIVIEDDPRQDEKHVDKRIKLSK